MAEEFARRLMMAGLNHEVDRDGRRRSGHRPRSDQQSARLPGPHRHRARGGRAIASRYEIPAAAPAEGKTTAAELAGVCDRMPRPLLSLHARVIRGVRVGPSPAWMQKRLATAGHRRDQQHRGHLELRAHGMRPAAAHVRLRQAPRAGDHRPPPACRARRSRRSTTRPTRWNRTCASSPTPASPWPSPA